MCEYLLTVFGIPAFDGSEELCLLWSLSSVMQKDHSCQVVTALLSQWRW